MNVAKAKLEGLFADELALLQPTPGYMRLLKELVLQIWVKRRATTLLQTGSGSSSAPWS